MIKCDCWATCTDYDDHGEIFSIEFCPLHDAAPKMEEVLKKFKFLPDCGGDFCEEVTNPIMDGDYASCCHWGYCRWAYEYTQEVKEVLEQVEGVK